MQHFRKSHKSQRVRESGAETCKARPDKGKANMLQRVRSESGSSVTGWTFRSKPQLMSHWTSFEPHPKLHSVQKPLPGSFQISNYFVCQLSSVRVSLVCTQKALMHSCPMADFVQTGGSFGPFLCSRPLMVRGFDRTCCIPRWPWQFLPYQGAG